MEVSKRNIDACMRAASGQEFNKAALDFGKIAHRASVMLQDMHTISLELRSGNMDAYLRNRLSSMVDLLHSDCVALKSNCAGMAEAYHELLNADAD